MRYMLKIEQGKKRKQIVKEDIEWYYCKKAGHTTWNCKLWANDLLKGRARDKGNNMALLRKDFIVEESWDYEYEVEKCDNVTKEDYLFWVVKPLLQEGIKVCLTQYGLLSR